MKELLKKLADFQQDCPVILKDTTAKGEKFSYQYADLPAILEVINPLLKKHGLMFTQPLEYDERRYIRTILYDIASGETLESRVDIPEVSFKQMNDYQALGSGITYMRRYALSSLLGIVTDKDTDAQGEQKKPERKTNTDKRPWLTEKQFNEASQRIKSADPYVNIENGEEQIPLIPKEFVDKLLEEYQMKNVYKEGLNTDLEFQLTLSK